MGSRYPSLSCRVGSLSRSTLMSTQLNPLIIKQSSVLPADDRHVLECIVRPALPQIKHGVTVNEGFRFVALGETGSGKTSLMRACVYYAIGQHLAHFALVHDTKGMFPEYRHSVLVGNVAEFIRRRGFSNVDIPVVSFRGDPKRDLDVSAEEVAYFSLMLARKGSTPHVTVIEELAEASTAGRKHVKAPSVLKLAEQGRKMGVSLVGTTQSPRKIPLDLLGQASSIAFFRLTGADANYLEERLDLNREMINAVKGPSGEGLPNHQFVLYVKGEPWDKRIYKLDKRTALMFE